MRRAILIGLCVGAFIALPTSHALAGPIVFSDSTFNLAGYTQTPVFKSDPAITVVSTQCASCGNPATALDVAITFPGPLGSTGAVGFVNNAWSYDPSLSGAVFSIDAFVDKDLEVSADNTGSYSGPYSNSFRPLIQQGGSYYLATIVGPPLASPGSTGYNSIGQGGLTAANFQLYDFDLGTFGIGMPDFGGSIMRFGVGQISSTVGINNFQNYVVRSQYDNLNVTLNTVPEPSTILLLGTGILGIALRIRRRAAQ